MVGVLLAGGAGRRMGGGKPGRELAGRPLLAHPAAALAAVCERVAAVCKPGEVPPPVAGVEPWDDEPAEPRHPGTGIAHALARAGAEVLVCAADMPFVTASECGALAAEAERRPGAVAVVGVCAGRVQPLLGVYRPAAAAPLRAAAERGASLTEVLEELGAVGVELPAAALRGVDTPAALAAAEAELTRRGA